LGYCRVSGSAHRCANEKQGAVLCAIPRAALNDNPAHFIGGQCAPAQLVLKHYGKAWAVAWCDQSNNIFHNADA